jgi:anhydro-N-acetylmuramic acid kinase
MASESYLVTGLMSGTSLDGLDIACCRFHFNGQDWTFEIAAAETLKFPAEINDRLAAAAGMNAQDLKKLDADYGTFMGRMTAEFHLRHSLQADFISSHGYTVFHRPDLGYTMQIGHGSNLAAAAGLPVVCDFRTGDVARGGQGAPLVPVGDELLFGKYSFCLNIGGFTNVSSRNEGRRIAWDICPSNLILNYYARRMGYDYDPEGKLAAGGQLITGLLEKLDALDYYTVKGPKSLGTEWINSKVRPLLQEFQYPPCDILRTYTEHIARQIAFQTECKKNDRMLITGGGAHNRFLSERVKSLVSAEIIIPSKEIIDFKEALIFAFLGVLRLSGRNNCLASVTGASEDHCSGAIHH